MGSRPTGSSAYIYHQILIREKGVHYIKLFPIDNKYIDNYLIENEIVRNCQEYLKKCEVGENIR